MAEDIREALLLVKTDMLDCRRERDAQLERAEELELEVIELQREKQIFCEHGRQLESVVHVLQAQLHNNSAALKQTAQAAQEGDSQDDVTLEPPPDRSDRSGMQTLPEDLQRCQKMLETERRVVTQMKEGHDNELQAIKETHLKALADGESKMTIGDAVKQAVQAKEDEVAEERGMIEAKEAEHAAELAAAVAAQGSDAAAALESAVAAKEAEHEAALAAKQEAHAAELAAAVAAQGSDAAAALESAAAALESAVAAKEAEHEAALAAKQEAHVQEVKSLKQHLDVLGNASNSQLHAAIAQEIQARKLQRVDFDREMDEQQIEMAEHRASFAQQEDTVKKQLARLKTDHQQDIDERERQKFYDDLVIQTLRGGYDTLQLKVLEVKLGFANERSELKKQFKRTEKEMVAEFGKFVAKICKVSIELLQLKPPQLEKAQQLMRVVFVQAQKWAADPTAFGTADKRSDGAEAGAGTSGGISGTGSGGVGGKALTGAQGVLGMFGWGGK
jgi:hypothetical protein